MVGPDFDFNSPDFDFNSPDFDFKSKFSLCHLIY